MEKGEIISKNIGKIFEDNWAKSVPGDILCHRPPDAAQGFDIGSSTKLRFSQHSPCDFMMFDGFSLYTLEMKSVAINSISFERCKEDKGIIHKYQLDSLSKFSKYKNVVSGFILDFRKSGNTYFVYIDEVTNMIDRINKKSFNEKDLSQYCSPIAIKKIKLRVNYRYDVALFINQTSRKGVSNVVQS